MPALSVTHSGSGSTYKQLGRIPPFSGVPPREATRFSPSDGGSRRLRLLQSNGTGKHRASSLAAGAGPSHANRANSIGELGPTVQAAVAHTCENRPTRGLVNFAKSEYFIRMQSSWVPAQNTMCSESLMARSTHTSIP